MIVCKACGNRNGDSDEFCTSCGRYLAWSGEHIDDAPEETPEEAPEEPVVVEAHRPGFVQRVRTAIGMPVRKGDAFAPIDSSPMPEGTVEPESADDDAPGAGEPFVRIVPGTNGGEGVHFPPDTGVVPAVPASGGGDVSSGFVASGEGSSAVDVDSHVGGGTLATPMTLSATADEQLGAAASNAVADPSSFVTVSAAMPVTAQVPAVTPRRPGDPVTHAVPVSAPESQSDEAPTAAMERGSVLRRPTEVQGGSRQTRRRNVASDVALAPVGPAPGDVFCHRCNQFNAPTRIFCRRCGEELHPELAPGEGPKYQTLDFWQRHLHRDVEITAAGKRPGRWGRSTSGGGGQGMWMRVMTRGMAGIAGVLLVLSFIGPAAQPIRSWFTNVYHDLVHKVDITYTQVFAIGANATSQIAAHPASYAVDDAGNTYWLSKPTPHDGAGQAIVVVFAQPTNIDRIGILSGAGPSQQEFLKETAPKDVVITFTGRTTHYTIREHLQDTRSFQRLAVSAKSATSMTMRIVSVYPSPLKSKSVAVTEIEFFQRT